MKTESRTGSHRGLGFSPVDCVRRRRLILKLSEVIGTASERAELAALDARLEALVAAKVARRKK